MFIKHGDGKITAVIEEDDLSEDQKKTAKNLKSRIKSPKTEDFVPTDIPSEK